MQTIDTSKAVQINHDFDLHESAPINVVHCLDNKGNPITVFVVCILEKMQLTHLHKGYCNEWLSIDDIPSNHFML